MFIVFLVLVILHLHSIEAVNYWSYRELYLQLDYCTNDVLNLAVQLIFVYNYCFHWSEIYIYNITVYHLF